MAYPIHGKIAKVTVDGASANEVDDVTGMSVSVTLDTAETTKLGTNWKTHLVGVGEWGGSIEAFFNPGDTYQKELLDLIVAAAPVGQIDDLRLQLEDAGDYWNGTIIITGLNSVVSIGDVVKADFSFIGSGAPTLTIA
jgi:hypothetical protein